MSFGEAIWQSDQPTPYDLGEGARVTLRPLHCLGRMRQQRGLVDDIV